MKSPPSRSRGYSVVSGELLSKILIAVATSTFACEPHLLAAEEAVPAESDPILRLDTGGPTARVTSVAFHPQDHTLYAAGWDKVVRAWSLKNGGFVPDRKKVLRVPVGPGLWGAINAIAISPDGKYLAMAGLGMVRSAAGFRQRGVILPSVGGMTDEMLRDQGTIFVANLLTSEVRSLQHHKGPIIGLAFAPGPGPPLLVSVGQQQQANSSEYAAVLHVWNVDAKAPPKQIILGDVKDFEAQPGIAVRRIGGQATDVQVASAWHDGVFRVWDVATNKIYKARDQFFNRAVILSPNVPRGWITTSCDHQGKGRLRDWKLSPAGQLSFRRLNLTQRELVLPCDMAVVKTKDRTCVAMAAFALQPNRQGFLEQKKVILYLVDLKKPQSPLFERELWTNRVVAGVKVPVIAVSADYQYVAVGGGPEHVILVFKVADLLDTTRQAEPQRLRTRSASLVDAQFMRKGEKQGIRIIERDINQPDTNQERPLTIELLFDFDTRELLPYREVDGWTTDQPPLKNWRNEVKKDDQGGQAKPLTVIVRYPDGTIKEVELPLTLDQDEITAHALLPPAPPGNNGGVRTSYRRIPLLAIASHDRGQPQLSLFNVDTGDWLRQFTGHTERITSLAFSEDGRFLVSTADDRTLCTWSLTDLDALLNKHGKLKDVTVANADVNDREKAGVKVVNVAEQSPSAGKLKNDDRLIGYLDDKQELRAWNDAPDFYKFWWSATPKTQFTVRRIRGRQALDTTLTVHQGTDERKPLFSFFLAQEEERKQRQWIGWSPFGPFESSDREIEQSVGWHFNTGDTQQPTKFADLHQYRDRYFREGLLRELIRDGELNERIDEGPLPQPVISLWIPELELQPDEFKRQLVLRDPTKVTLALALDFGFPGDRVAEVECRFDEKSSGEFKSLGKFQRTAELEWEFDLSQAPWTRGANRVEALVRTREHRPQEFPQYLTVRYHPPPPKLELLAPAPGQRSKAVGDDELTIRAKVAAAPEVRRKRPLLKPLVNLFEFRDGKRQPGKTLNSGPDGTIEQKVQLNEGSNHFELSASYDDDFRELESTTVSFSVTREGRQESPTISLRATGVRLDIPDVKYGQLIVSPSPRLKLQGTITGGPLTSATWSLAGGKDQRILPAGQPLEFALDVASLEPGVTKSVRIRAESTGGITEFQFEIRFEPPFPEITILSPSRGETFVELQAPLAKGPPRPKSILKARLSYPDGVDIPKTLFDRLQVSVWTNHQGAALPRPRIEPVAGDRPRAEVTAEVPLDKDRTEMRFRLNYDWDQKNVAESEPIVVVCYEPPEVKAAKVLQVANQIDAQLEMVVKSRGVSEVAIGDKVIPRDWWTYDPVERMATIRARVDPRIDKVVEIRYGAFERKKFPIPKPLPVPEPLRLPDIELPTDANIVTAKYPLEFVVTSPTPVSRVELRQTSRIEKKSTVVQLLGPQILQLMQPTKKGLQLNRQVQVELQLGENHFELVATNSDGFSSKTCTINRIVYPPRLLIDGIGPQGGPLFPLQAQQPINGPLAIIKGRVIWDNASDARLYKFHETRVWVNGFQQAEIPLGDARALPNGKWEREFQKTILLSRHDNLVVVELARLEHVSSDKNEFRVLCNNPNPKKRLHLLVIGVGTNVDADTLAQRALETLEGELVDGYRTSVPTFETQIYKRGFLYGPLTGDDVDRRTVNGQLQKIRRIVRVHRRGDEANDVVIVYYAGGELVDNTSQFYLTTEERQVLAALKWNAIPSEDLLKFVETTRGAHLFLLDVERRRTRQISPSNVKIWPSTSHGAMLRYAWTKQGDPVPTKALLISALQEIAPRFPLLGQVYQQLDLRNRQLEEQIRESMQYDGHIPDPLTELELRQPPEN